MNTLQKVKLKLRIVLEEGKKEPINSYYFHSSFTEENEKEKKLRRALRLAIHVKKNFPFFIYLEPLLKALFLKDRKAGEHSWKVAVYSILIADTLRVDKELTTNIYIGALFHDIGKIGIPDKILFKKEKVDKLEKEIIKNHPVYAYEIFKNFDLPIVKNILLKHHERIDGKGYPLGVNYREIPFYVNIVSVCDVFDALTERRPYREPIPLEEALAILEKESGRAFYPEIVSIAVSTFNEIGKIDFWTIEKLLCELEVNK
jgi:putative nucleotidyltransferase with HDIG domain